MPDTIKNTLKKNPVVRELLKYKRAWAENRRRTQSANYYKEHELNNPGDYYSQHCFDYYRCIFIHVPKAAGVSMSKTLFGNYSGGHIPIDWYLNNYGEDTVKKYFKFTFVRNPWSRLHSAYFFLKKGGFDKEGDAFRDKYLAPINSFEEFVMEWFREDKLQLINHFVPQYKFVTSEKNQDKVLMDFVGRFENINVDFATVCKKMNRENLQLQSLNVTAHKEKGYAESYSKEMMDKVQRLYQKDIELFGYTFNT